MASKKSREVNVKLTHKEIEFIVDNLSVYRIGAKTGRFAVMSFKVCGKLLEAKKGESHETS